MSLVVAHGVLDTSQILGSFDELCTYIKWYKKNSTSTGAGGWCFNWIIIIKRPAKLVGHESDEQVRQPAHSRASHTFLQRS